MRYAVVQRGCLPEPSDDERAFVAAGLGFDVGH
jgi:hypothetical protein